MANHDPVFCTTLPAEPMCEDRMTHRPAPLGWPLALLGLFLTVFAGLALSGPGRIDIIDGQARYEVARSLVEHGDVVVRDPDLWFPVTTGRDGKRFTNYRLPPAP